MASFTLKIVLWSVIYVRYWLELLQNSLFIAFLWEQLLQTLCFFNMFKCHLLWKMLIFTSFEAQMKGIWETSTNVVPSPLQPRTGLWLPGLCKAFHRDPAAGPWWTLRPSEAPSNMSRQACLCYTASRGRHPHHALLTSMLHHGKHHPEGRQRHKGEKL